MNTFDMDHLLTGKCVPCQKGAPKLTPKELEELLPKIPEWEVMEEKGTAKLCRTFTFKDFKSALTFVNQVGKLAEKQFHHPTLVLDWGKVKVIWTTHKIKGLHENDVMMAVQTDRLFSP